MAEKTAEILDDSHVLYGDLDETLTILKEMEVKKELPPDIIPALLSLLGVMVSKRTIPVALKESLTDLNQCWSEPILAYLYRKEEEVSKVVSKEICKVPQLGKADANPAKPPVIVPEKIAKPIKTQAIPAKKVLPAAVTPPKNISLDTIIKMEPRNAEAEVVNLLDHFRIENTRIMLLLDILKGHTLNIKREQWNNDDSTLEKIKRICDDCQNLKKIILTNERKGYSLADEESIYALSFMGMENCSIFVVTTDARIIFWKDPLIEFEKSLLDPEGIEPKELLCLIFITQPEPELLEMQFAKFIRPIK